MHKQPAIYQQEIIIQNKFGLVSSLIFSQLHTKQATFSLVKPSEIIQAIIIEKIMKNTMPKIALFLLS